MGQFYIEFFGKNNEPPSADIRREYLDPTNPVSPYFGFIGNRRAVDKLIRIDFEALGRYNHRCNDLSIAFLGQAGCGKTELARRHAAANKLPFVEISPKSIKSVHDIFKEIYKVCDEFPPPQGPLTLRQVVRENHYIPPPINVFIDEVHTLSTNIVQGLLKATEPKDAILVTERGITVDCKNIHWMIATTDRGKLFDAFDTRFTKCILNLYTKEEVARVVQTQNPDWELSLCRLVAHFCGRIPREALAFAREMQLEYNMNPHLHWPQVASRIAEDNEIDELGMTYKRLKILKSLGKGPIAEKRLPFIIGVKAEELEKFIMPWLLEQTEDQQSLVAICSRGYILTEAGAKELTIRNIPFSFRPNLELNDDNSHKVA